LFTSLKLELYLCLSYAFVGYARTVSASPFQRMEEVTGESSIQEVKKTVETETWQENCVADWSAGSDARGKK
jgi:hypothetical protein